VGDLHELVGGFEGSQTVAAYERGRPDYAPGTVPLVVERLRLAPGARVLDLAAGTGRLARPLLAAGMDVVAVEPLADMRAFLAGAIGAERVLDGRAEAIPLPDGSLAAVVVGNAWHWFDGPRAVVELARVLAPGGGVAIVVNEPVPAAAPEPWEQELAARILALRGDAHPGFTGQAGREAFDDAPAFTPLEPHDLLSDVEMDVEGLLANLRSISFVGALPEEERTAWLGGIRDLIAQHGVARLRRPFRTTVWISRRRG
jgi:SAM-dependent methyltransferase